MMQRYVALPPAEGKPRGVETQQPAGKGRAVVDAELPCG
jgi:hypothetical protein